MAHRKSLGVVSLQPDSSPEIDVNGMGKGLIFAPLLSISGLATAFDVSGRNQVITIDGSPTVGVIHTPAGRGIITHPSGGASGVIRYSTNGQLIINAGDFSAYWMGYPANTDGTNSFIIARGQTADSVRLSLTSATNMRFSWIDSSPAQFNLDVTVPSVTTGIKAGQEFSFCITKIGGLRALYVRAQDRSISTGTQSTGTSTGRSDASNGWLLGTGAGGRNSHQNNIAMYAWNRGLSPNEALAMLMNPWLPYKHAVRRRIISQVAAAVGFDGALMAAMWRQHPDLVYSLPQVSASGMTPPNLMPN